MGEPISNPILVWSVCQSYIDSSIPHATDWVRIIEYTGLSNKSIMAVNEKNLEKTMGSFSLIFFKESMEF